MLKVTGYIFCAAKLWFIFPDDVKGDITFSEYIQKDFGFVWEKMNPEEKETYRVLAEQFKTQTGIRQIHITQFQMLTNFEP